MQHGEPGAGSSDEGYRLFDYGRAVCAGIERKEERFLAASTRFVSIC